MKSLIQIVLTCLIVSGFLISGCKKDSSSSSNNNPVYGCMDPTSSNYNSSATVDNGTCQYKGNVTFWYNSSGSSATVIINGQTGYVTMYYPTYNPSCGSSGCANFTLPTGSYSYTASSSWNTWSGTVTITKGNCSLVLLQ